MTTWVGQHQGCATFFSNIHFRLCFDQCPSTEVIDISTCE